MNDFTTGLLFGESVCPYAFYIPFLLNAYVMFMFKENDCILPMFPSLKGSPDLALAFSLIQFQ